MHRHSHARTLMFANAASVLTQAVVRILKFGVLLASSSFTGCSAMSQSTITGLGASTRSVCLSHSLEFWQQQQKFTVVRPHLNFICRVFQGRATGAKPNWAFNVDANSGHAFGILLAAVGTLRPWPLVVSCGNQRRQSVVVVAPCGHVGKSQSGLSTCPCGLIVHELEAVS